MVSKNTYKKVVGKRKFIKSYLYELLHSFRLGEQYHQYYYLNNGQLKKYVYCIYQKTQQQGNFMDPTLKQIILITILHISQYTSMENSEVEGSQAYDYLYLKKNTYYLILLNLIYSGQYYLYVIKWLEELLWSKR